jgi:alpha-glucosidase
MADYGYDIADYTAIDPLFGDLADFDVLIQSAQALGLKVILDLVPNHTSDQHPWFAESRGSLTNPKRDWYIWHDPSATAGPPNNWLSDFGGSAWQYDDRTRQYYYHAFLAAQPDLNWRNPEVRNAIYDAMRFWLSRGVDGFRIDVIWHLIKDDQFRDNPPNPRQTMGAPSHERLLPLYTTDRPEVQEVIAEMRGVANEFVDCVLIGEIYLPVERLVAYYGRDLNGLHLPFNFSLLNSPWSARAIADLIEDYEARLPPGGWPNWVLGNHDRPRIASRVGTEQARVAAMLLLTLRGTPTIYYGDEIGMEQVSTPEDRIRDPLEINIPGRGLGRDGCRTAMQWNGRAYAGFSTVEPWLPLPETFRTHNVETERAETTSLYNLYRRLLALRRSRRALSVGTYRPLKATGDLLLFIRGDNEDRILVALNFGGEPISMSFPSGSPSGRLLISSAGGRHNEQVIGSIDLRPHEGAVIELAPLSMSD